VGECCQTAGGDLPKIDFLKAQMGMNNTRKRGILICFVGIDGSGKTTQAQALAKVMREEYQSKVRTPWVKFEPKMTKPFLEIAKWLFFRGKDMYQDYADYLSTKRSLLRNWFWSTLYRYLLLIDYFPQVFFKIRLPLERMEIVICDRYIYDTVVDLAVDSNYPTQQLRQTMRYYSRLFPRPDMIFLLDLPEEIARQRKGDIPSLRYLTERRKAYLAISQDYKMRVLDGTAETIRLGDLVKSEVVRYLREGTQS